MLQMHIEGPLRIGIDSRARLIYIASQPHGIAPERLS